MKYVVGVDLAKGNDRTAYIKINKETGKIKNVKIIKNKRRNK